MTHALPKKYTCLVSCCVLAIGTACGTAWSVANRTDATDLNVQRTSSPRTDDGLCWHMGMGSALICDPNFVTSFPIKMAEPTTQVSVATEMAEEVIPAFVSERVRLHSDALFYTTLQEEPVPEIGCWLCAPSDRRRKPIAIP